MSRSRRRTPIAGHTTARSDKWFKSSEHRRERAAVRSALSDDADVLPHPNEFGSPWASPKDGKRWMADWPKVYRK